MEVAVETRMLIDVGAWVACSLLVSRGCRLHTLAQALSVVMLREFTSALFVHYGCVCAWWVVYMSWMLCVVGHVSSCVAAC